MLSLSITSIFPKQCLGYLAVLLSIYTQAKQRKVKCQRMCDKGIPANMSISVRYRLHVGISRSAFRHRTDVGPIQTITLISVRYRLHVGKSQSAFRHRTDIGPIYDSLLVVFTAVCITRIPATSGVLKFGCQNTSRYVRDIFNFFEFCLIFCGQNLMIFKVNKCC